MKQWINKDIQLYNEDCIIVMDKLIESGIQADLTVTSPPYDDIRNYNNTLEWNFDVFKKVADRLYKITKDGGVVVWVVGDKVKNGGESLNSFRQALYFQEIGFNVHDTMIYEKNTSSFPARRDGNRYTQIFEYMFVLSKGKPKTANLICDKENKYAGYTNWGKNTQRGKDDVLVETSKIKTVPQFSPRNNIWRYIVGGGYATTDKFAYEHPAIFPEKLAQDHILSWSNEGDLVLDCFMGSNTTGKMAKLLNRKFIGIEKVEKYFDISIKRIEEVLKWNVGFVVKS